jgi:mono/diheme cytochrome c family protein
LRAGGELAPCSFALYAAVASYPGPAGILLGRAPGREHEVDDPPLRRWPRLAIAASKRAEIVAFTLLAALSNGAAAPADAAHGKRLAKQWCAACHIVSADQKRGADAVPSFASIAKMPGFSPQNITQVLMNPHPKMPDMQLTRDEARDHGAYIASLAH